MTLRFNLTYLVFAIALFFIEVMIGLYAHDAVIRPYGGDFLVVILLYCLVHSFIEISVIKSAAGVLAFAYAVETLQYFHFISVLRLERSAAARIIMGTNFEWTDMLMYSLGILLVLVVEIKLLQQSF